MSLATDSNIKADGLFEVGKLYCDRGDFFLAIDKLSESADLFFESKDFENYVKAQNLLLRIYAETEQDDKITVIKEKLQDLVINQNLEPNSKTYYTLALCASYKGQQETAIDYLQKALNLALAKDNKVDICYAISGLTKVYSHLARWEDAARELENLKVFFQILDIPELKISALLTNALLLSEKREFEKALDLLWSAYEMVRSQKTLQMHIYLLYAIGRVYLKSGDKDLARMYLNLAAKAVDPNNMTRLARHIENDLAEVGGDDVKNYDLVFDLENHSVIERRLGRVDFKNQFILLDLLRLFVQHQGQVYSKEFLVENVWKQSYDPAVHDNKVYVTIKRLRKLIEPDFDRPKYIFRAKNGYFMNKTARILMGQGADRNQIEGGQQL